MAEIGKSLNAGALPTDLQPYALFQAAGCLDLQSMGLADVEMLKNQRSPQLIQSVDGKN